MTLRLSDLVVCGEVFNTSWYSVHGWLALRGREQVVHLQLTGNCAPDLAGWHFRFEPRDADQDRGPSPADLKLLKGFAWQQVGPTGMMTIQDAAAPDESREAVFSSASPTTQDPGRRLYLEWFSQNGRVIVELADPKIELVEYNDLESNPAGPPRPRADTDDELFDGDTTYSDAADEALEAGSPDDAPWDDKAEAPWLGEESDEEDPYDLLPDDLKQQFDEFASQTDKTLELDHAPDDGPPWLAPAAEDSSDVIRELELMDDCIEQGEGELLTDLFEGPLRLPRPDQLVSQEEAERVLKTLLAQLARCGVSLAVCHHFTPRDAYRLLIEEICVEERAYRELKGTQWVQTFMTSEYCPKCEEEFEREYQEYERRRRQRGDEGSDDVPF
jgi:hypothetical protein